MTQSRPVLFIALIAAATIGCSKTEPATGPTDLSSPVVTIDSPAAGDVVGPVTIMVSASDDVAVSRVAFEVNNNFVQPEYTVAPYQHAWDPAGNGPGTYTWVAVAWDAAGNEGRSPPVTYRYFPGP